MTLSNADRLEIIALLGQFHEYLGEELDAYTSPDGSIVDVDFDDAERARRLRSRIEKVVESIEETPGSLQAGEGGPE